MSFKRTITHWDGGGGRASKESIAAYHEITEFDGNIVQGKHEPEDNIVTSDGDYAAHTRNLNTDSIGLAMAGMKDATEHPLNYGPAPINRVQFEAHCKNVAKHHMAYGIPVTNRTCITHAEVEPTLGVKQNGKWDLTVLPFEPTIRGAIPVGDYMRERVRAYMGITAQPSDLQQTVRLGSRGSPVVDLQMFLAHAGYFTGKRDGIFGPRTKSAVVAFQSENGLITDGIVGPSTWAELMRAKTRPARDVSMQDLRESGSTTIGAADTGQKVVIAGSGVTAAVTAIDQFSGAGENLAAAETTLASIQNILIQYWPLIAILGAAFVVWRVLEQIKTSRLRDAQTGKNMGR